MRATDSIPQTIRSSLGRIVSFSAITIAIVLSPAFPFVLSLSSVPAWWSSLLEHGVQQSAWGFLGVAGATIIALQIAVRDDGSRGNAPRERSRRQFLALASIIIGGLVLNASILVVIVQPPDVNVLLVGAAGAILVFLAAEAGTALEVPSKQIANRALLDRYKSARQRLSDEASTQVPLLPKFVTRVPSSGNLKTAIALTLGTAVGPPVVLWLASSGGTSWWSGFGLLGGMATITLVQLLAAISALWLFMPGPSFESKSLAGLLLALAASLGMILGLLLWEIDSWQYFGGYLWSLSVVVVSVVSRPRRSGLVTKFAIGSAFRSWFVAWLDAKITGLGEDEGRTASEETEALGIEQIRAWLVRGSDPK
jgi:hypothetical protein